MKRSKILIPLTFLALSGCEFVSEGVPADESSSGFADGDTDDPSASSTTASATTTATTGATSATTSSTTSPGSDSESSTDPTFGDDATTTHGEDSSSGEATQDWALSFDGTSYARKIENKDSFEWPSSDFTVELWIDIKDVDATGIIFDTADVSFTNGWVLYLHNDWHALVFSFFDAGHQNNVVVGPYVDQIGAGWHHVAATKSEGMVFIHVDGVAMPSVPVASTLSFDNTTLWSLGGSPDDNLDFRLHDVVVDDVRLSSIARYEADFVPPSAYDPDDSDVILALELDEGSGDVTVSADGYVSFSVNDPVWIAGNSE